MKKKILVISLLSLFAISTSALAEDALKDTVVQEDVPELTAVQTEQTVKKESKGIFSWFKKKKNKKAEVTQTSPELGQEVEPVIIENSASQPKVSDISTSQTTLDSATSDVQASVSTTQVISVDDCIKYALENHPSITSALGTAEIYKTKIGQAWSNYFPTFSAGLSYSRVDSFSGTAKDVSAAKYRYNSFLVPTISANMLIFDFGKTKSIADYAKRNYEASQLNVQDTITQVIFNVKASYYNLLFALQQEQVYEDTVRDYELHLKQAKAYYDIGTKPKIDVLTAEYNLGNANLNLIKAKNTVQLAYVEVSNAMGLPEFTDYKVKDKFNMKAYDIKLENALETAFETRPSLLSAKKQADASGLLVKSSLRAFAPDISAFGTFEHGGKNIDTDSGFKVGGQIAYQSVNFLLLKKQVDEAKATYKRDLANFEAVKQQVYLEVKDAYLELITAQNSINVAKLSMDRAEEQYNQANGRYKVGLGDAIELKDAENTFRNAQLNYYSTLLNYHVSAANLERVIGTPVNPSDVDL